MIKFDIAGEPKAKQRPRHGKGFTYTPKETVNYENYVKMCYLEKNKPMALEGMIQAEIDCFFTIPKSFSKKKQEEAKSYKLRPTKKPDVDNIAKSILDSLNGIAYKDDSQIVDCEIHKYYSSIPRVEVTLKAII